MEASRLDTLSIYALDIINTLQPFLDTLKKRKITADILDIPKTEIQIVHFRMMPYSDCEPVQVINHEELASVTKTIEEQVGATLNWQALGLRRNRIYAGNNLYVIKPSPPYYWGQPEGLIDGIFIFNDHQNLAQNSRYR
jgi:hypothetical protein